MLVLRSVLLGLFWLVLGKFTESDVSCKWSIKTDEGVRCSYSSQNHGSWEWVPTTLAWSSLAFVLLREPKSRGICRVTRYSNTHCLVFGIENCMKQKMLGFVLFLLTVWRWLSWQWLCVSVCLIVKGSWIRVLILLTFAPFQGSTSALIIFFEDRVIPFANQRYIYKIIYIVFHGMFVHVNFRGMPEGMVKLQSRWIQMRWLWCFGRIRCHCFR